MNLLKGLAPLFMLALALPAAAFTGSDTCKSCHASEFENWRGSHHDLAMQEPDETTVLADFDDSSFSYGDIETRFFRKDGKFVVRTDGEDGKLQDFTVAYVFGVYPLQQYLLPLSRGRLQALSIAWDSRPSDEGGQRWFHLYPDEVIKHDDPLHWTGPYQNWNTRCAECHSTDLKKNYDLPSRSFNTTFEELNVSCEACHGPGDKHLELAAQGKTGDAPSGGFPTKLQQRGEWQFQADQPIAQRLQSLTSNAQIDNCGRCHARRGTLGDYHYGADLLDTHRLSLPQSPLYHYDGQILDEVYVYGSFRQSKMHQAGVVCSNCHEPHSLKLRAEGNGVCAQCHQPASYDNEQHHHHPAGSSGAQCANCHMPETTYMEVDPRRDHSIRIPRPDLSVVMGTPNACTQCHTDKRDDWALSALRGWGVQFRDTARHPARAFQAAANGDTRVTPQLSQLATSEDTPAIWRAAAMESLGELGGRDALQTATQLLYSDDPLLRVSTIRALQFLPLNQRFQLLEPLLDDDITSVRMEVANSLAGVPLDQVTEQQARQLSKLFNEFTRIQQGNADMPSALVQLGIFYVNRNDLPSAEGAYREALRLNPQLIPAQLNLADLLRSANREDEARQVLLTALEVAPEHGPTMHSLGLLEARSGNAEQALDYLGRAAQTETVATRYRFVYAIALHDLGQPQQAVSQLQALLRIVPQDQQVLLALANYSAELGQRDEARRYAAELNRLAPSNSAYQQLMQSLLD
jgi:tetratricopeptide (TPR) repeat protein